MKRTEHNKAFTIVELLTVMAVIALLIGLLVPALAMVRDRARDMQQRAQFHSISTGLEMFQADFGDYPESHDNFYSVESTDERNYGGAQKLAEALVGYDLLGVHPRTAFRSDGQRYSVIDGEYVDVYGTSEANIDERKGPYLELENANAFQMRDVYGEDRVENFNPLNVVLTDVFSRSRPSGVKTGTPVLYFRANTLNRFQEEITEELSRQNIYNFTDNHDLLNLGTATSTFQDHRVMLDGDYERFNDLIVNEQVYSTSGVRRPYRAGSFILWSAGKDGSFGTATDIFNFVKEMD